MSKPWIRLYTNVPGNPKVQRLPAPLFKFWINCLCLYGERGYFPPASDVAWTLNLTEKTVMQNIKALVDAELFDEAQGDRGFEAILVDAIAPHDWDELQFESDTSRERQKKYRERRAKRKPPVTSDVTVTPQEQSRTEQIQNRAEPERADVRDPDDSYLAEFSAAMGDQGYRDPDGGVESAYFAAKVAEVCEKAGAVPKLAAVVVADLMKSSRFRGKPLEYLLGALRSELAPQGQNQKALQKVTGIR